MKKGKFLAVAIIVSLILLVQPNIRTTIWNFFDSQDIVSQLGFKGSSIPNVKSTQPSVTNDSEKQEIQKKQKEIIQSLKEFTFEGQQVIEVNGNQPVFSNSDLTIPSRVAVALMLKQALADWERSDYSLDWEAVSYNMLGSPHGQLSSLFINRETGLKMRKVWQAVCAAGVFESED